MTDHLLSDASPRASGHSSGLPAFASAGLAGGLPGLVAAFSTALPRQPDAELAPVLRSLAAEHWGQSVARIPTPVLLHQTHSARVLALGAEDGATCPSGGASPLDADGAWAHLGAPRLLAVKTADCVPLLAVDAERGCYAALHAGWRGAAAGILPALLEAWRADGSSLRGVSLELGPHIQGCCYEVQADCLAQFPPELLRGAVRQGPGHTWLHLAAVLRNQAVRAGVPAAQVRISTHCTYCRRPRGSAPPYASYRRTTHAGQPFAETNVALIGLLGPA